MRQPGLGSFQGLRLHVAKVTTVAQKLKSNLTWYYYNPIIKRRGGM
jgi:hypothetical protein